ncbi:hypothetical protein [Pseudoalteromonas sp. Of7M-16]|uniref:hypothetical protein n=1 Tax=Pseudoalteromonas sp. Of7M-16 TaxID=2917756 RepID=UPI001EF4FEF0|nr:hypothetical protein [Pseudoalteromonas sp. Of7M-16]MCG7550949.1 hypothetical protein [Pseudoalteromonas sp. Of7M-16]
MNDMYQQHARKLNAASALSVTITDNAPEAKPDEPITETAMFESVEDSAMFESAGDASLVTLRSNAMAAVLTFGTEGLMSAEELDGLAIGIADVDEDGEVSEEEQDDYEDALNTMAQAAEYIGVDAETVEKAFNGDDDAAETVSLAAADKVDDLESVDEYITKFSVRENMMLESSRKVVRDGKVKWIKKPLRKRRLSSAQRSALKKARRKAHTGAAKRNRRKSMRLRSKSGLK